MKLIFTEIPYYKMDSTLNTGEQLTSIPKVPNVASLWISI